MDKKESIGPDEPPQGPPSPDVANVREPRIQQPWIIPREYEIGGVRWFSDAVRELDVMPSQVVQPGDG